MAKYKIVVDKDLQDIVPAYIESKKAELVSLSAMQAAGNLEELRKSGHKLAGSGGGYGFDRLSEIGRQLETAARTSDVPGVASALAGMKDYLENLEVVYE